MSKSVPTYWLYGESRPQNLEYWIHYESIASRSRFHDWEIKQHRHDAFVQILHIASGGGEARFGDQRFELARGMIVTVPPRHTHGFRFETEIQGTVLTLLAGHAMAAASGLGTFLARPDVVAFDPDGEDYQYVAKTVGRLEVEIDRPGGVDSTLTAAFVQTILTLAYRASRQSGGSTAALDRGSGDRIEKLNALVGRHFREHQPVEFYAQKIGVSVTHLNRIATRETGKPVGGLLAARLASEAKRDLLFTDMPVQQIAYDLGFADHAYFSRFFVRLVGQSPLQYRRSHGLQGNG